MPPVLRRPSTRLQAYTQNDDAIDVTAQYGDLFPIGATYAVGQDLIGYSWLKNEVYTMRHEEYVSIIRSHLSVHSDIVPSHYLVVPVRESTLVDEVHGQPHSATVLGVIVLYQVGIAASASPFPKLRGEALSYVERIALYLQNDALSRKQQRASEYLQLLQGISSAFPTSVKLSDLVENIYQFVSHVVDVSCMLLTLYDRDLDRLYDVFAVQNGRRVEGLAEHPTVHLPTERPVWWRVTQLEKKTLPFSPTREPQKLLEYQELLKGVWGDQSKAESFLLLPMKMFNRVIGAICVCSTRPHAYPTAEIQVLETMAQIVTVSIENTRLYERDRAILHDARQREAQLAAINSALQSISSELNVMVLLNNLVESVANVTKVSICVFFGPSSGTDVLVAHALYAPSSVQMVDDGSGFPELPSPNKGKPDEIINLIELPFKGTFLEHKVNEGFFYLDQATLEDLSSRCNEGGLIFLRETHTERILMVPMSFQTKFLGLLAVPMSSANRFFRPKDIATVLAICAQAASAIRNAQLFEQRAEANAELERLNKLKDEFLVTASHELRTPLTAISGYSSQLKRQSARATPQTVLRFATRISVAAQQLSDQVAKITEAAQIGPIDRKLELQIEPIQVLSAAEMAANMLGFNSEQTIALDIPGDIWISGDAPRVRQVLTNLLENASKYSPPGATIQVTATVLTLAQVEPCISDDQLDSEFLLLQDRNMPVVLVRVKDQGEGVLPEDRKRIFDKFVRAPRSLTTPVRGSGLGLYICRRFIEAMNGRVWLEQSTANEGSTFSFYLPQMESPVEAIDE
jgi:signal transduction histidine kinase